MYLNILLQVCDLPNSTPMSKLAYWQSEALSRELPARVGSQSPLNARQLVSCPSLLAATLVSDPAVVMVPLQKPPKRSAVSDWLRQQNYGQPVECKNTTKGNTASSKHIESKSTASDLLPVDYGQPIDSKHSVMSSKNTESVNAALISTENQLHETLKPEKKDFDVGHQKNDNDNSNNNGGGDYDDEIEKKRKKSLLQRGQFRVSFLADVGQNKINLMTDEGAKFQNEDDPVVDKSHVATVVDGDDDDDDDSSQKLAEGKSPVSESSSILLGSQFSSSGRSLPKASFIDLEVPDSWRACRQSQMSDSSRYLGNVDLPPVSTTTPEAALARLHVASTPTTRDSSQYLGNVDLPPVSTTTSGAVAARLHVASTPTTRDKSRQNNELVDLSVISCSPITPRTTSDQTVRSRCHERTLSPSVEARDDDDDPTVIPCSPLTPSTTSVQSQCVKNRTFQTGTGTGVEGCHVDDDDDDDITVIPCTPATPTTSQEVKDSCCNESLSAGAEDQLDDKEAMKVIPCSPVTPTTTSSQVAQNKPQRDNQRISRLKVLLSCIHIIAVKTD